MRDALFRNLLALLHDSLLILVCIGAFQIKCFLCIGGFNPQGWLFLGLRISELLVFRVDPRPWLLRLRFKPCGEHSVRIPLLWKEYRRSFPLVLIIDCLPKKPVLAVLLVHRPQARKPKISLRRSRLFRSFASHRVMLRVPT